MDREREQALILMMENLASPRNQTEKAEEHVLTAMGLHSPRPRACRFEPGRRHLPAEIGGRIAKETPRDLAAAPIWNRACAFSAEASASSRFQPLSFDAESLTYSGTILWG